MDVGRGREGKGGGSRGLLLRVGRVLEGKGGERGGREGEAEWKGERSASRGGLTPLLEALRDALYKCTTTTTTTMYSFIIVLISYINRLLAVTMLYKVAP